MDNIDRTIEGLKLIALDLRRSASDLDESIRKMERVKAKDTKEHTNRRILKELNTRKEHKDLYGFNDLNKREKLLWKKLEKEVRS